MMARAAFVIRAHSLKTALAYITSITDTRGTEALELVRVIMDGGEVSLEYYINSQPHRLPLFVERVEYLGVDDD